MVNMLQIERCQGQVKGQGGGGLDGLHLIRTLDCKRSYQISCLLKYSTVEPQYIEVTWG